MANEPNFMDLADPDCGDENSENVYLRKGNNLPRWGNHESMNLNSMVLTNILQSPYYVNQLSELSTYHEVVDEIYYRVEHLEPWERGSRRTGGQTGMCGGVRGVGAGGIVSTPFCLLFKLFQLKITKKQLMGMLDHRDSPYIRALGFMYIRYCLNPTDLWSWYEPYLDDNEEIDVKAGGGYTITVGEMLEQFLTKLDWFSTLFPRIPVPAQKKIEAKLKERMKEKSLAEPPAAVENVEIVEKEERPKAPAERSSRERDHHREKSSRERDRGRERRRDRNDHPRSRSRDRHHKRSHSPSRDHRKRSRSRDKYKESSFERDLRREKDRQKRYRK